MHKRLVDPGFHSYRRDKMFLIKIMKAFAVMDSFEHFCPEHIGMLITIAVAITAGLLILKRSSDKNALTVIRILSLIVLLGETVQDILLVREGGDIMGFLPLHLCNLGLFLNLAASFIKGKAQSFFAEISLVLIMPGSIGALLFPDWTYRPFWSYLPLLCFLTHSLTVFIPLAFLIKGRIRVSFKHFWYPYLFLLAAVPPIYLLDIRAGQNYMFLLYPPQSSPLEWIYNITGDNLYISGLIVLLTVVLLIEYSLYTAARKISKA